MSEEIEIPFGYKRVEGQSQRYDGVWNGKKFVPVRKDHHPVHGKWKVWPRIGDNEFVIRRCEVVQAEIDLGPDWGRLPYAGPPVGPMPNPDVGLPSDLTTGECLD